MNFILVIREFISRIEGKNKIISGCYFMILDLFIWLGWLVK